MDDRDFKIKTVEFHLANASAKYNKCVATAIKDFLETNKVFSHNCDVLKKTVVELFEQYKALNNQTK
jgi:hypothetical protein